ncbi:MAG: MFS transporter [Rhizomicrobium sp.]|jgi:Na+/melibiose symporter-like transporter
MAAQQKDSADAKPTLLQLILFAFPSLPHSFVALPLNIVIPAYYAAHTSVSLLQIASVTTLSRVLDAFFDPTIGFLSDRTRSPLGRRKPWVLVGALVCAISIFFLFRPPHDADFVYYGIWSFLLYFGFTLFEIPRNTWMAEITRDYFQRARINTYVAGFNIVGSLVFWIMPLALVGLTGTTAITDTSLSGIAFLYAALMPAGIVLAVAFVPVGRKVTERLATLRELFHSLRKNKPFWSYNGLLTAWGLGQGAYLSVIIIFLSDYLGMAADFPILMICFFAVSALSLPLWQKLIARYGKHRIWSVSMLLDVSTRPLILLVPVLGLGLPMLLVLNSLSAFLNSPANICPGAVLGDVVDYDLMKTNVNKAGNIFAFNTLLVKATMAAGAGLAFTTLDLFHYRVGHANTASANLGLIICYLIFPAIMYFISSAIAWRFPIDAARHSIIRRRIERRAEIQSQLGVVVP